MSWERIEPLTRASEALGALRTGDAWIFRGTSSALACAAGEAEARWETEFGDETMSIGPKIVVPAGGAVATLVEEPDGETCTVVALDPAKGTRKWKTKLKVSPGAFGLAALGEWVLVHGTDAGRNGQLFALAADGGKVGHQVQTETANGVHVAGGRALVPVRMSEGVYAWKPGGELEKLSGLETELTAVQGDAFFARIPGSVIVELDAKSGKERGRVKAAGDAQELFAMEDAGRVLLTTDKGARVLDVRGGKAVGTLAIPRGMGPTRAAVTPHGVVVAYSDETLEEGGVVVYDADTGKKTQELAVEATFTEGIYYADGQLVVSAGGAIHFFEWKGK